MWSCTASQVLTHLALLKPALQAWWGVWGCGDQVLTHVALLRSALQAWWGPQGLVLLVRLARVCDSGLKRRFPVAPGAAIVMTPFAGGMVQKNVSRNRPPNGPTARHNLAADNARWNRVRAPQSVPEFTANAFDDHDWRIRAVSLGRPKSLKSLGCSGGMPSPTPHFVGNDKG